MSRRLKSIERIFPGLFADGYEKNSREADVYNCIAFAAGDVEHQWDGYGDGPSSYWPTQNIGGMIEHLISAYQAEGFEKCDDSDRQEGYEKVALYWKESTKKWTHAARLRSEDGWWESKLGQLADIVHRTPQGLVGEAYGQVALFMRRRTACRLRFRIARWLKKKKKQATANHSLDIDATIKRLYADKPPISDALPN